MEKIIHDIASEFNRQGYQIFEIGGHVRDRLLNRNSDDIDMATDAIPEKSKEILEKFGSVYTIGIGYGTVGLTTVGQKIEVTTYRGEVYPTDSRKPNVLFGKSLIEDLRRRDFTINAIACSPLTGKFFDPFHGMHDINHKIIRCVGSSNRLEEDPLRMLRAIRFAVQLDFDLRVSIRRPERLVIISKERIREELTKILLSPNPDRGIKLLCNTGLMLYVIPEFLNLQRVQQGKHHIKDAYGHTLLVVKKATDYNFDNDNIVFRLACLLHDIGKPYTCTQKDDEIHFYDHQVVGAEMAKRILTDLKYDSNTIERVCNLVFRHMEIIHDAPATKHAARHLVSRMNCGSYNDIKILLALGTCDMASSATPRYQLMVDLKRLVEEVQTILPVEKAPLNGDEIMAALGIEPSRIVGEIKEYISDQVVEGVVQSEDKEGLIKLAKEYYNGKERT